MRMLSASQLCFGILLIAFQCHTRTKAEVPPRHDNMIPGNMILQDGEGYGNETRCSWNCTVTDSDFPEQRKTVLPHNRLFKLVVMYEQKVDEKCVNQTSLSSNRAVAENWQIWQPEDYKPSSFALAVDSVLNVIFSSYFREHRKINAVCNFKPMLKAAESLTYNDDSVSSRFIRGHLADLGLDSKSMDCNIEKIDDLKPHINVSNSTGNNTDSHLKQNNGWTDADIPLVIFGFVFIIAFIHYSPAFLCLFSPTMVTENGVRQISLEGASPVSLRSLRGNYFYSEVDTLWHRTRTLILRAVVVPLPFLAPAIVFNYVLFLRDQDKNVPVSIRVLDLSQPLLLLCFAGYFLQAIFDSYFNVSPVKKPCLVCRRVKPNFNCNDELPRRILHHLQIQPLVLVKCWRLFCTCLVYYFKMSQIILPSCKVSTAWFLRIPLLLVFLSTIPAFAVTLLVSLLLVALFTIVFLTSPAIILCDATRINEDFVITRLPVVVFVRIFITLPAVIAAMLILLDAACGVVLVIVVFFILVFSEKGLPFVACFVLVCYYLWSSYSSFTNKYHDLSLTLFKFYKKSQHEQISSEELLIIMDPVQDVTPNHWDKTGHVVRIPKGLFDMACEELMPIREGVCKLLLELTIILSFVFLTFWLIMKLDVSATPVTKALVTFFTRSFPKIVAVYFDGERQRKLEATVTEEKAPKIVQDYVRGTPVIYEI